jgi:hypothetical protein
VGLCPEGVGVGGGGGGWGGGGGVGGAGDSVGTGEHHRSSFGQTDAVWTPCSSSPFFIKEPESIE